MYMVPVCGPVPAPLKRYGPPGRLPPGVPLPGSQAPCNVASSVCAGTIFFKVAPSPSVCASVQVQEKIL